MKNRRRIFCITLFFLVLFPGFAGAATTTLAPGAQLDLGDGGSNDLLAYSAGVTALRGINGTQRAWASCSYCWNTVTLADAQAAAYASDPSGGGVIPGTYDAPDYSGEVMFYKTATTSFYKLRSTANSASGITIEYVYLGQGYPPAPTAGFSSTTYDLYGIFTDTSTGTVSGWSWTFGDGGTSTSANPRHKYGSGGTYNVCLTASNVGASDQVCQNVTVTMEPATSVAPGGSIDFDPDASGDLAVSTAAGACGAITNKLNTAGTAQYAYVSKDYRAVMLADAQAAAYSASGPGGFCIGVDYLEPIVVKTSGNALYKVWTADNTGSGIRFVSALLGTFPDPPVASFTSTSYDLIGTFTDTSTGEVSTWAWDFGDGGSSSGSNPQHRFGAAGDYTVCLTAGNVGGTDQACSQVTVAERPSTVVLTGGSIDLNGDGTDDLAVASAVGACSGIANLLATVGGATYFWIGTDYRSIQFGEAPGGSYGSGSFCPTVDFHDAFIVRTASGRYVKVWTAANGTGSVRLEFEVLGGPDFLGVFNQNIWYLDLNDDKVWNGAAAGDGQYPWPTLSGVTDLPVVGDWDHDGDADMGQFRAPVNVNEVYWRLDANGNRAWDQPGGGDVKYTWPWMAGDLPAVGDWDRDGFVDDPGVFRVRDGVIYWRLDANGNGTWDQPGGGDVNYTWPWLPGDLPVVGDWNRDGFVDDVGVFRVRDGVIYWRLDANGNGVWDQPGGGDVNHAWPWLPGDLPVVGDWNGDGYVDDIGVVRVVNEELLWRLDANGNGVWDQAGGGDVKYTFGVEGDIAVPGQW